MKYPKLLLGVCLLATVSVTFSACSKKKDTKPKPRTETYKISEYGKSGITGTAKFEEILNADSVKVTIDLKGNKINDLISLPIAIRKGTALEDGGELYDIGTLKGNENHQGQLVKTIALSFDGLQVLNGGLTVKDTNNKLAAETEIGTNRTFKAFTMIDPNKDPKDNENGEFRIYKRATGSYLVIKLNDLENIPTEYQGIEHPAKIYNSNGSPDTDISLSPVSDANGISATLLSDQDYKDLIKHKGFIKVLASEQALDVILSKGDF